MFTLKNPPLLVYTFTIAGLPPGGASHARRWGVGTERERGAGIRRGRSARTGCLALRGGLGLWAAVYPRRRPPGMKYCTRGEARGNGVQEVSWDAGTPSWSLRFPQSRQEGEEGLAGCRSFLVRKTEGPGWGARHPPTPRFPGTWAVSVGHTRAPPEEPGRTWGAFLGLLVGTRGPQSTSRARPWGQGRPHEQGRGDPFQGCWPFAEAWGPTGVAWSEHPAPPTHTPSALPNGSGKARNPEGCGLVSLLQAEAGQRESEMTGIFRN